MRIFKYIFTFLIIFISVIISAKNNNFLFQPSGANFFIYGSGGKHFLLHQNRLTRWNINKELKSLTSGKRINNAADDPTGLAVAEKIASILKQLQQESLNDANMRNFYQYVESAIAVDLKLLKRIHLLIVRSSSGILTSEDRSFNQTEINQLLRQIDMNAKFAQFNKIQVIPDLTIKGMGLEKVDVVKNLYGSFKIVESAQKKLQKRRIVQGVKSNIMTFRIKGKSFHFINLQKAESNIRDLDYGVNSLIKNNVMLKTQYGIILKSK